MPSLTKRNPIRKAAPALTPFGRPARPAPAPPPPAKPSEAPPADKPAKGHTCNLKLQIDDATYSLRVLPREPGDEIDGPVIRLRKLDGDVYDVTKQWGLWECTCADFVFRIADTAAAIGDGCKHIQALRVLGLIPALTPRPLPRNPITAAIPRRLRSNFGAGLVDAEGCPVNAEHDRWAVAGGVA